MRPARKSIALTLILSLVIVLLAPSFFAKKAQAVTFTEASVTISDSRASKADVSYAFSLGSPSGTAIKTVDIYFCTNSDPNAACTPANLDTDPGEGGIAYSNDGIDGSGETVAQISGANNSARITVGSILAQTTDPVTFTLGGITNTSDANSAVYVRISTFDDNSDPIDYADAAIAVLATDSIYVTADVQSIFEFNVTAVATGVGVQVNGTDLTTTATDSTIPFGTLTADTPQIAAHDINIKSNATNGYLVTVQADADPPLSDGATGNNIDNFSGSNAVPIPWSGPTGETKNVNTGFFGYTTEDSLLTGDDNRFDGGNWAGTTTSPEEVMYNIAAPGSGLGDTERVGWQIEVDTFQPPGAYTGSVVLIATPTY